MISIEVRARHEQARVPSAQPDSLPIQKKASIYATGVRFAGFNHYASPTNCKSSCIEIESI
jgi:hypothetical protein